MSLSNEQLDVLKEVIHMGIGRSASMLNELLNSHVSLVVPDLQVFDKPVSEEHNHMFLEQIVSATELSFKGPLQGSASLVFPPESASKLVDVVTNESGGDGLDAIRRGTLTEVGNIVLNGVMGVFGNLIGERLIYSLPAFQESVFEKLFHYNDDQPGIVILAHTDFTIQEFHIEGDIILILNTQPEQISDLLNPENIAKK